VNLVILYCSLKKNGAQIKFRLAVARPAVLLSSTGTLMGLILVKFRNPTVIDQRSLMFYATTTRKCLPRIFVLPSVSHITDTKNPCVLVLTRCHVTDINHVLTRCHVTEINYVDRGVAARTPLQFSRFDEQCLIHVYMYPKHTVLYLDSSYCTVLQYVCTCTVVATVAK